jgi:pimeloyl-ACP methyl ester carboxylesterase
MTPQFLPIRGIDLAYYEKHPDKERTIFFLHGNSSSSRNWLGQWESPLFEGYRLIAIDLPAHGASGVSADPATDYTLKGLAVVLSDAVNALARGPYIICATSLATNIVAEMIAFGITPAGILLEGASVVGEGVGLDKVTQPGVDISPITMDEVPVASVEGYSRVVFHDVDGDTKKQFVDDFLAVQAPFRTTIIGSIFSGQMSDQVNLLRGLSCPVAHVYGAAERVINTGYLSDVDVPKWRNQILLIPGAGHLAHVEQPEAFNELLFSFTQDCL